MPDSDLFVHEARERSASVAFCLMPAAHLLLFVLETVHAAHVKPVGLHNPGAGDPLTASQTGAAVYREVELLLMTSVLCLLLHLLTISTCITFNHTCKKKTNHLHPQELLNHLEKQGTDGDRQL